MSPQEMATALRTLGWRVQVEDFGWSQNAPVAGAPPEDKP